MASPAGILVTDFDGTLTDTDFYHLAIGQLIREPLPDYWSRYVAGELTHFDGLNAIFSHIRVSEAELEAAVRTMGLDPGLPEALERLERAGWELVIASAGCAWYIERLLGPLRPRVTVHANPGHYDPARGLVMRHAGASPFHCPQTGVDKAAIVRDAQARTAVVAFAGDGRPDRAAALLVPPARRFARGILAEQLTQQGEPFQPFTRWSTVVDRVLDAGPARGGA